MAALRQCEFFLLRYVPNVVQDQPANIGIVLLEIGSQEPGFVGVRFTTDWRLVRLLDPHFDVELLDAFEDELRRMLESRIPEVINYRPPLSRRDWILQQLQSSFSNVLQVEPVKLVETASPQAELRELAKSYFKLPPLEREVQTGVVHIRTSIKNAFDDAGVWPLMRKNIELGPSSRGDNLKIYCGYRPNGVLHMFHPVSLATNVDSAKLLAFSYSRAREELENAIHAMCDLTAIVENGLRGEDERTQFAIRALVENAIQVATMSQMPQIAERARVELRL